MTDEIKRLRRLAEAMERPERNFNEFDNYYDAVDPKTILSLIDRLERAEADNAKMKAAIIARHDIYATKEVASDWNAEDSYNRRDLFHHAREAMEHLMEECGMEVPQEDNSAPPQSEPVPEKSQHDSP